MKPVQPVCGRQPVPELELRGVCVGYGSCCVLDQLGFSIAPGQSVALVGANASGKSTLLSTVAGLLQPLGGELRYRSGPRPLGRDRLGRIGVCAQSEPPSGFSVAQVIDLGLDERKLDSAARSRAVHDIVSQLALSDVLDQRCDRLSGGQWRRVLLARALVASPALLLLDEPTNHFDPRQRGEFYDLLANLRGRTTVLLATHDLDCIAACERVLALARARIVFDGSAREFLAPAPLLDVFGRDFDCHADPQGRAGYVRLSLPSRSGSLGFSSSQGVGT